MKLDLRSKIADGYTSPSQKIRVLTEYWLGRNAFCPACVSPIDKSPNNSRVLDFRCVTCGQDFELKSKRGHTKSKIVDGAYCAMMDTIERGTQPNFFLLNYDENLRVQTLMLVPKRFIVPEIVEKRKPLSVTAHRAGWVGCNLLVSSLPSKGMIYYVEDGHVADKQSIQLAWQRTSFLDTVDLSARGWTVAIMSCVESLQNEVFTLEDMYRLAPRLERLFPRNRNVKAKIRQQLQLLRDRGWLNFLGHGVYSLGDSTKD